VLKAPQRILAPVDLSVASEASGRYAMEMARQLDAEVIFLYVVAENSLSGRILFPRVTPVEEAMLNPEEREKAWEKFRAFLALMKGQGVRIREVVEKGVPHARILQAVETLKPDVVVQGTHGSKGFEDRIIGGTAERIIRKTKCPVLSVKPMEFGSFFQKLWAGVGLFDGRTWTGGALRESYRFPPKKILYATDFSEASRLAMEPAVDLAHLCGAELVVLHIAQERSSLPARMEGLPSEEALSLPPEELMEILIREMQAYQTGLNLSSRILWDESTSKILSVAMEDEVDLLVMGTRGLTGWELVLNGSTADNMIHNAPCPVLTVRPNWKLEKLGQRFRRVFRTLSSLDLQKMSSAYQATIEHDLMASPDEMKKSELFLNFYSVEGIRTALEGYGILDNLRREGFEDFRITLDLDDPYRHRMRVHYGDEERDDHLLLDLVAREGTVQIPDTGDGGGVEQAGAFSVLHIEWICMQNPVAVFSTERPPLPGQEYPGLGIGYEVYQMLVQMGVRVKKEGIMNRPQHYHNAKFYHEKFKFLDPVREGRLIALIRDTEDHNLADVGWAVYHGCLVDEISGQAAPWEGGILVSPLAERLRRYFASRLYHDIVWETVANSRFRIDWELFRARMQNDRRLRSGSSSG
jgi:nucleotide-binding universal stress UspA family protein